MYIFLLQNGALWDRGPVHFGICATDLNGGASFPGEILLGDVIENDSWRLWEDGDPKKMRDWQLFQTLYDNKEEVRQEVLDTVKEYYTWAANKSKVFQILRPKVVINSFLPEQNDRHFADAIFRCISWMKSFEFWVKFHWSLFLRI